MGTGLTFKTAKEALVAEYKKAGTAESFLQTVVPLLEEITGLGINVSMAGDEDTDEESE